MAADPAKDFRQVGGCKAFAGSNLKNPESQKSRISKIPNLKNPESQKSRISKIHCLADDRGGSVALAPTLPTPAWPCRLST